jgi:transposase InsO family protein
MTKNTVILRLEFVTLARAPGANVAALCRRFGISRKSGYKWLARVRDTVELGGVILEDRSRRPQHTPRRTSEALEARVVALRTEHPAWGPRKLRRRLADLGAAPLPAPSTVGAILRRRALLDPAQGAAPRPHVRFERSVPNELWQMDFKGHFALSRGGRCHPLTLLDDHSRFSLGLRACARENGFTVQRQLEPIFERYGLPEGLLCDNAPPWSGSGGEWTALAVWLVRLGIRVLHGRPYHPQTQGKEERFHRTLKAEVLTRNDLRDLAHSQQVFDAWRPIYNHQRPHEALALATPASRYAPSARSWPAILPPIEYAPGDEVRTAKTKGEITWRNRTYFLGQGLARQPIALRPTACDGLYEVFFCHQRLGWIDRHDPPAKTRHHYLPLHRSNPRLQP